MLPRKPPEERLNSNERLIIVGIGALIFGGFAADLLLEFAWLKAGAVVLFFAWLALIVVHEGGHALVAAALGWRVCRIAIGMGPAVFRFRIAKVPIMICRYPVGGHIVPAPIELTGAPWKSALIYAAGPGAEALVIVLLAMSVGVEQLLGAPEDFAVLSAQAICVAALMGVVLNLIPIVTAEGAMTDGLGILTSPWLPAEAFESRLALPYTTRAETLLLAGRRELALLALAEGVEAVSHSIAARVRLSEAFLDAQEPERVVELLGPLVARDDVPASLQPVILSLLSLALLATEPERLDDANEYTEHALKQAPDSTLVKLARSRVLIELGRLHPANSLLEELGLELADERWVDTRDVYRALIEVRSGRAPTAAEILGRLLARGARGPELQLLIEELGPAHNASQKHA